MLQPGQSRANPRLRTQTLAPGRPVSLGRSRALESPNNKMNSQNKKR